MMWICRLGVKVTKAMEYQKKVSVIMGVYNQWNREYLEKAVDSILSQTLTDFEFLIYDDGSAPEVANNIEEIAKKDDRIVLIHGNDNNGLAFALNVCIDRAKGEYIARMDADDISFPKRLEKQVNFLDTHTEYWWCGSWAEVFNDSGAIGIRKMPHKPQRKDYLKYSPYIHPSVMYRAELFGENVEYKVSQETLKCEDYEIFMRLEQLGYHGCNIPEILIGYREDKASFKKRKFKYRLNEAKIRWHNFKKMHMLLPFGWIQAARPLIGGLIPSGILAYIKKNEIRNKKTGR